MRFKRNHWIVLLFSLAGLAVCLPGVLREKSNIVAKTYWQGAERLYQSQSPYQDPKDGADVYKYSPFFAMLYGPMRALPETLRLILWAFINIGVFWWGVSLWLSEKEKLGAVGVIALILCSMELNGAILYQQINALLVGLCLVGVAQFRKGHYLAAGVMLAIATSWKILPGLFLVSLLLTRKARYWLGVVLGTGMSLIAPGVVVGWSLNIEFHQQWLGRLFADTQSSGLLDIQSALLYFQLDSIVAVAVAGAVAVGTALPMFKYCCKGKKLQEGWPVWLSIGLGALLLLNPRTESPTFVLIAPAYVLMAGYLKERKWALGVLFIGAFFTTLSYNDVWPKSLWNPHSTHNFSKTFGVLIVWLLCFGESIQGLFQQSSEVGAPITLAQPSH